MDHNGLLAVGVGILSILSLIVIATGSSRRGRMGGDGSSTMTATGGRAGRKSAGQFLAAILYHILRKLGVSIAKEAALLVEEDTNRYPILARAAARIDKRVVKIRADIQAPLILYVPTDFE